MSDDANVTDYPNNGQAIGVFDTPPDEQQEAKAKEEQMTTAGSLPVIKDLLAWFDDQIAEAESIKDIVLDDNMTTANIARQVMVQKLLATKLRAKRGELQGRVNALKQQWRESSGEEDSDEA